VAHIPTDHPALHHPILNCLNSLSCIKKLTRDVE
jgi:hypothetical protein